MKIKVHFIEATSDLKIIKKAIEEAEKKDATIMTFETSGDEIWNFEWIVFYKELSVKEVKEIEIEKLKNKIKELKNEN